jgi:hypothetical protein
MSVPKLLPLAAAAIIGFATLAQAAPRGQYRNEGYRAESGYGAQGAPRPSVGSNGGYSADPNTAYLERLADKYKPGW